MIIISKAFLFQALRLSKFDYPSATLFQWEDNYEHYHFEGMRLGRAVSGTKERKVNNGRL